MHVTACLAGQMVEVEVGEDCRTLQALKESIVKALPILDNRVPGGKTIGAGKKASKKAKKTLPKRKKNKS